MITASSIAIICPTKNQPEKVKRLLTCLSALDEKPAQVIIADAGHNLKPVVEPFLDALPLECLYSPEAGQILQRNHARQHLASPIRVVLHIDDDITVEPDFMACFLKCWNRESQREGKPLAGMSFNMLDQLRLGNSILRRLFFLSTQPPGSVSKAGYAAPFTPTDQDRETSWLVGGTTAWSRDILTRYPHPFSYPTRWAVCEDLIYSYPLRMDYRLMVVKDVPCYHNETYSSMSFRQGVFYGVSSAIMRYHFIRQHDDMKTWAWLWMTTAVIMGNLARGLMGSPRHLGLFVGGLEGMIRGVFCSIMGADSTILARSLAIRKR